MKKVFYLFILLSLFFSVEMFAQNFPQIFTTQTECLPIDSVASDGGLFEKGLFLAFIFVFVGGFLTSLTPCAFPIILISIPALTKEGGGKAHKFLLSLIYVLGIATMYSLLGVVTASTGKAFGMFMQNPIVVGVFVIFFIAMGLSSLGAFIIQLPSGMMVKMNNLTGGTGYVKAFFSGLFLGVLAAPCVGPVLAGVLAYIAQTGNILLGFLLLTTFAFGMGVLILIIGTFSPNWRSGAWMTKINTIFGILLFAVALYFLKDISSIILTPFNKLYQYNNYLFIGVTATFFIVGTLLKTFSYEEMFLLQFKEKIKKVIGAILIALSIFMFAGMFLFIQGKSKVNWLYSEKPAIEKAIKEGKPIMIDFGAKWCAACKELEKYTYNNESISEYLNDNFISVYIDCTETEDSPECVYANDKYNVQYQLPTVVFIESCGRLRDDLTLKGFEKADEFIKRLKKIK